MHRLTVAALFAGSLCGQTKQPQELLKEAVELHQKGDLEGAIRDYTEFLDMYPDAAGVRSNLGAALVGVGRYSLAIDQYQRALASKPDPGVRLNLALAFYKAAQYKDARRELEAIHAEQPANKQAVMLLADCALRMGDYKTVIDVLTPFYAADSTDLGLAYLLGTALARDGQTEKAQVVINPILSRGDSAEARLLMGTTRFNAHDYARANEDLAKAVELNPKLPDVYTYYGLALFALGDQEGGRKAFEKALENDANDFEASLHLGTLLRIDHEYDRALTYLRRAAAVRPGDLGAQYQIALVVLAQGKTEQARQELEALIKAAPSFTEAHVSLATVYYREKRNADGDRERAIVQTLNAERQAKEPGAIKTSGDATAK
jgi:tetratricopeptide (TPR) repeat protein